MSLTTVYLGLGGNIGDRKANIIKAVQKITHLESVVNVQISPIYETTPVIDDDTAQPNYYNAVCRLETLMTAKQLIESLQKIERELGKVPKPKTAPRIIDIDLLFFGEESCEDPHLTIPHPRWKERMFVLVPLSDLTSSITIPSKKSRSGKEVINLKEYLKVFSNDHHETIKLVE